MLKDKMLTRLMDHNVYATRLLLECCESLADEMYYDQQFEIGLSTIHATMAHIVHCMERWNERIGEHKVSDKQHQHKERHTPVELIDQLNRADKNLRQVVATLECENRFEEMMQFHIAETGQTYQFTRGTAVIHVLTHGVHHRAQVLNMLRQAGVKDLPDLDAIDVELASSPNAM